MKSISTCKLVAFSIAIKSRRQRFIPVSASISIPNVVDIYTDGSCLNNGKKSAISGIGLYFPTRLQMNVSEVLLDASLHTNNRAELLAIVRAVEAAASLDSSIRIYTDSAYAYKGLTVWIYNWILKGRSAEVKNFDLFSRALSAISLSKHSFYITHILGHKGIVGNEEADKLAKKAVFDHSYANSSSPAQLSNK